MLDFGLRERVVDVLEEALGIRQRILLDLGQRAVREEPLDDFLDEGAAKPPHTLRYVCGRRIQELWP